jgi:hypothetical protein
MSDYVAEMLHSKWLVGRWDPISQGERVCCEETPGCYGEEALSGNEANAFAAEAGVVLQSGVAHRES